jgi:molybdopterin molybdotransferase
MISVKHAKKLLQRNKLMGKTEVLPLEESVGFYLAEDVNAPFDIPFFNNSAMDGYAIVWQDNHPFRKIRPETKIRAGEMEDFTIGEDEAIRIFTGAPVPNGADTIIPQVWVNIENDVFSFEINKFEKGANLRKKGAQNKKGDLIASKGAEITPGMIGLLASVGLEKIQVYSPPSVGIIVTGDELIDIGKTLGFGQVFDANGPVLKTYLQELGIKNMELTKSIDNPVQLQKTLDQYIQKFDVIIISGGISVGDYDFVKGSLEKAGVKELFYKVKQKPGKPLFAGQKDNQWIFALPGNPASTLTCFNQYVKPCLLHWMGKENPWEPLGYFPLQEDFRKKPGLSFFLKARLENGSIVTLPGQESFNLISYGTANCIAELNEEGDYFPSGTMVPIYLW